MAKCFLAQGCTEDLIARNQFSEQELKLLCWRSGCKKTIKFVCTFHNKKFLLSYESHQTKCCDPFDNHSALPPKKKKKVAKSLSSLDSQHREKGKTIGLKLIPGKKICVACKVIFSEKLKIPSDVLFCESSPSVHSSIPPTSPPNKEDDPAPQPDGSDGSSFHVLDLTGLNIWLESVGLTAISLKKLKKNKTYCEEAVKKLRDALKLFSDKVSEESDEALYFREMIQQIKDYINDSSERSKKILALSVLPKSWSISEMETSLGVTNHMARTSKSVVKSKGILSIPNPKLGHPLSEETKELVILFYLRDDISRPLPGSRDFVSVKENGKRVHKRKRLVLSTLLHLHSEYVKEHPQNYLSSGLFCEMRPKECVLAGSSGTHVVCVCVYHENPRLMFEGGNLKLSGLINVGECRALLLCPEPTVNCHLLKCDRCPDELALREKLEVYFDEGMIDTVSYNQWITTDRGTLETVTKESDDFTSEFIAQIKKLIPHDFIAKEQSKFYKKKIESLQEGEVIINFDFAENYSFNIQRSIPSQYFNKKEATVHPCIIHFKIGNASSHKSLIVISDHLDHSTAAVHYFMGKVILYVKETLQIELTKVYYMSDGCAAQYKNKKSVANVWFHERDFGVPAEWHFYATSHGKSACDGLGGSVKHKARLHSLRATEPGDEITTAEALYNYAKANMKRMDFVFVPSSDIQEHEKKLEIRFHTALDIDGIQSHHAILPVRNQPSVRIKVTSNAETFLVRNISTKEFKLNFEDVQGFVLFSYNDKTMHLGHVTSSCVPEQTFTIEFLKPVPNKTLTYEYDDQTVEIFFQDVLSVVSPYFQNKGRLVKLYAKDVKAAEVQLARRARQ